MQNKIKSFIEKYQGSGFSGDCGNFAIALNHHLGNIGKYFAGINTKLWDLNVYFLGHVALKVNGVLYDINGVLDEEVLKSWGQVDECGDEQSMYNLTVEECYETEIVDLYALWGTKVENKIKYYTNGNSYE